MSTRIVTIQSIETYINFLKKAEKDGFGNVPIFNKRNKKEYKDALEKIEYWHFIQSADYHYFVSRILYLHHIIEYSQFCGFQCIENYLKAYIKFKQEIPPNTHDLQKLLKHCRDNDPVEDSFINNDNISIIIAKYEPFYELARYPVQRTHPKSGYVHLIPDDIYILDYFVMKMREILSIPENTWDILKDGHYELDSCRQKFPDFYSIFFENNINFYRQERET